MTFSKDKSLGASGGGGGGSGDAFKKETFVASGTISDDTNLALSTGTNTLTMPLTNIKPLETKSISGVITLDPGTNTVENGTTVSSTASRTFCLVGTVWRELG